MAWGSLKSGVAGEFSSIIIKARAHVPAQPTACEPIPRILCDKLRIGDSSLTFFEQNSKRHFMHFGVEPGSVRDRLLCVLCSSSSFPPLPFFSIPPSLAVHKSRAFSANYAKLINSFYFAQGGN